jgi:tetratricopeptide (TPR) repeat protein
MACAGQFEESIAQWEQLYSDLPEMETAWGALAALYALTGQLEKSAQMMDSGPDSEPNVYSKMLLLAKSGRKDEAEELIETVTSRENFDVFPVAGTLVELGEKQRALDYLEAAVKSDPKSMLDIQCWYQPLADEPRFQQLLDEIGYPSWARVPQ